MNVVVQSPEIIDGIQFEDRTLYLIDESTVNRDGDYGVQDYYIHRLEDATIVYLPASIFLIMPDSQSAALDPRSMQERAYEDNKQRDTNYRKVYEERMGIKQFDTYEEEDFYRHKKNGQSPDVGLPEDHSIHKEGRK